MKRLILVFAIVAMWSARAQDTCVVYSDPIVKLNGQKHVGLLFTFYYVTVTGQIVSHTPIPKRTDTNGVLRVGILRKSYVRIESESGGLSNGQVVYIPDTSTINIKLLPVMRAPSTALALMPAIVVKAGVDSLPVYSLDISGSGVTTTYEGWGRANISITGGTGTADTSTATANARLTRLQDDVNAKRNADSANTRDQQQADSLRTLLDRIGDRADADSLKTVRDIASGKGSADSLAQAAGDATSAITLAHEAMTRARIDSVYVASGALDLSDASAIQPDVVIQTAPDVIVDLPDMGALHTGWKVLYINASGGNGMIGYANIEDDPDNSGTSTDTVTAWQLNVIANNAWHVIKPGAGTVFDTTLVSAMLDAAAIRSTTFANEQTLRTNQNAALRDTSRGWRTYVNSTDTCLVADTATSGRVTFLLNPNCRTDQLAALVAAARADTNCSIVTYNATTRRFELTCDDAGGASVDTASLTGNNRDNQIVQGETHFVDSLGVKTLVATCDTCSEVKVILPSGALGLGRFTIHTRSTMTSSFLSFSPISSGGGVAVDMFGYNSYVHVFRHNWGGGAITSQVNQFKIGTFGSSGVYGDMAFYTNASNNLLTTNERMRILAAGSVGIGTSSPEALLHVAGRFRANDTIRSGNYDAYSYFIPGGALVQSSTREIKRNIVPIDTLPALLERFMSVDPVRYQFRPSAFRQGFDTSYASGQWYIMATAQRKAFRDSCNYADSVRAESLASKQMIGFLAEDLYAAGFSTDTKHIDQGELIAALWRVTRRLITRQQRMDARIDAIEARIKLLEAK